MTEADDFSFFFFFFVNEGTRPMACHPTRWRAKENGHQVMTEADFMPEFALCRLSARPYSSNWGPFPTKLQKNERIKYASFLFFIFYSFGRSTSGTW